MASGWPRELPLLGANVFDQTGPGVCPIGACRVGDGTALLVDFFFFHGKENSSARQIDAMCAVYSGFSYLL